MDPDEYRAIINLRYFGYALAVAAAFHPVAPQIALCLLKLITSLYLLVDIVHSARGVYECSCRFDVAIMKAMDVFIFHFFASLLVPCLLTYGIVTILGMFICVWKMVPSIAAVAVLPFIRRPVDTNTIEVMDCSTRIGLQMLIDKYKNYDLRKVFTKVPRC